MKASEVFSYLLLFPMLATRAALAASATSVGPVPAAAGDRLATVEVRVSLDEADWTYELGASATFTVRVVADETAIDGAAIRYTVGPEMMYAEEHTAVVPAGGLRIEGGTLDVPGFIRCTVTTEFRGKTYRGLATAGFAPEKIRATQESPDDFTAFWEGGLEELAKIPMEPRVTLLPEACTDLINVYHVSFRTVGDSWRRMARMYGMLCEPKAPGKYPAVLNVPGAGVRPYFGEKDLAARGAITLQIGIHGIPVNLPQELYDQLGAGALDGYPVFNLDNRNTYYYRRVYLGCVRANDFLTSRDGWDGRNLVVMGGSQGGQLSIITAGLDQRVTGLAATHPAYCDVSGYLHGRAGGWPHMFRPGSDGSPAFHATPPKIGTAAYYDAVNFARRLSVPGFFIWGYNDETCPPTSMFAAFNEIKAPKSLTLLLEVGHSYPEEQSAATRDWVRQFLQLN